MWPLSLAEAEGCFANKQYEAAHLLYSGAINDMAHILDPEVQVPTIDALCKRAECSLHIVSNLCMC